MAVFVGGVILEKLYEMKNKGRLAESYADIHMEAFDITKSMHLPYYHNDRNKIEEAGLNGFETAQGFYKSAWIKVEEQTPEYNKPVLLKYLKGKREVITQGYFQDEALEIAKRQLKAAERDGRAPENGIETADFWRRNGRGETYFDYSDRQIQYLGAKSKNKVIAWREIWD